MDIPQREPGLYYCIDQYLERKRVNKHTLADLAYQIYATHTGKLDLFRHYPRPELDPAFTIQEAISLVKNYRDKGSCWPQLPEQL